jgi:hypothetical protein
MDGVPLIGRCVMSYYITLYLCKSNLVMLSDEEYSDSFNMFTRLPFSFLQEHAMVL